MPTFRWMAAGGSRSGDRLRHAAQLARRTGVSPDAESSEQELGEEDDIDPLDWSPSRRKLIAAVVGRCAMRKSFGRSRRQPQTTPEIDRRWGHRRSCSSTATSATAAMAGATSGSGRRQGRLGTHRLCRRSDHRHAARRPPAGRYLSPHLLRHQRHADARLCPARHRQGRNRSSSGARRSGTWPTSSRASSKGKPLPTRCHRRAKSKSS